jgi:hypothetical protein
MNNWNFLPDADNNSTAFGYLFDSDLGYSLVEDHAAQHANVKKFYRTSSVVSCSHRQVLSELRVPFSRLLDVSEGTNAVVPMIAVSGAFLLFLKAVLLKGSVNRTLLQTLPCQVIGCRKCSASSKVLDPPLVWFQ